MKEQFVPYEIALKLKEKGFKQPKSEVEISINHYYSNKGVISSYQYFSMNDVEKFNKNLDWTIYAPLWQQVIDWLREKHFIDIMIRQTQKDGTAYYKITKIETEDKIKGYSNFCKTVNIARQAAIEHALTLI